MLTVTDVSTTCAVVIFRQVVETSVTVNSNSPIQDYANPDDQTQPTFEMTPGFKPVTIKKKNSMSMKALEIVIRACTLRA